MSEQPRDRGDGSTGSAPWERPAHWEAASSAGTPVEDLVARLAADPSQGRRRRRREAGSEGVAASDLIAALTERSSTADHPDRAVADQVTRGEAAADATAGATAAPADGHTEVIPRIETPSATPTAEQIRAALTGTTTPSADPTAEQIRAALTGTTTPAADPAGGAPERPAGTRRPGRRHRRTLLYAGRSVVAMITVLVLLLSGYEWELLRQTDAGLAANSVNAVDTADPNIVKPTHTRPTTGADPVKLYPVQNILLFGSDTRVGGNADPANAGDHQLDSAQSDVLMIAHISADRQHVTIVSIPRDLQVAAPHCQNWNYATGKVSDSYYEPGPGETWKITNAYAVGGPACTVKAVQALTGLGITSVIGIDFEGFKSMVDALGGVTVNICRPIQDAELNTVAAHGGVQTINGDQALALVRARKVKGDPTGDLGRIRRQQVVLSAMLRQAASAGTLLNPGRLDDFLSAFVHSTFTDRVSVESLVELAHSFGDLSPSKVTFYTLPTEPIPGPQDREGLVQPQSSQVFDAMINDQPLPGEPATKSSTPARTTAPTTTTSVPPAPQSLTVGPGEVSLEVVNVTGTAGVAGQAMTKLNDLGYRVTDADLMLPQGQVQAGVTVEYSAANRAAALTVASTVPGAELRERSGLGDRVRLLLGTGYDGSLTAVTVGEQVPAAVAAQLGSNSPTGQDNPAAATSSAPGTATTTTPSTGTGLTSVNAGQSTCA